MRAFLLTTLTLLVLLDGPPAGAPEVAAAAPVRRVRNAPAAPSRPAPPLLPGMPPPAWVEELAARFEHQDVRHKTLPNGVQLLALQRGAVPWCALATVLPGGARQDPEGQSGLAHLAEHLMFEGGPEVDGRRVDPDREAEELGIHANAFTLADYTVVIEEFSPAVLADALRLHAQRLQGARFSDVELAREKRVVEDERRYRVDEPSLGHAEEELDWRLWGGHAFGRPVLGWPQDLERIPADALRAWMATHLRPDGAVVALVGQLEPEAALAALAASLQDWRAPAGVPRPPLASWSVAPGAKARLAEPVTLPSSTEAVLWAAGAAPLGTPPEAADGLLAVLLDRDVNFGSAEFPEDMAEVDLRAELRPELHAGTVVLTAVPRGEVPLEELEQAVERQLARLAREGPAPSAVAVGKLRLAADQVRGLQVHSALAERLAVDQALLGRWSAEAQRLRALSTLTAADVQARAAAWRNSPLRAVVRASLEDAP